MCSRLKCSVVKRNLPLKGRLSLLTEWQLEEPRSLKCSRSLSVLGSLKQLKLQNLNRSKKPKEELRMATKVKESHSFVQVVLHSSLEELLEESHTQQDIEKGGSLWERGSLKQGPEEAHRNLQRTKVPKHYRDHNSGKLAKQRRRSDLGIVG